MNNFERVEEFTRAFGQPVGVEEFTEELLSLRLTLIEEELEEVKEEVFEKDSPFFKKDGDIDRVKLTKEVCDLLYVVYGLGVTFKLPIQEAFEEVHRSNMSKLGLDGTPIYNENGKVLKGPNYIEPNLQKVF